jgi:predicted DNA binding CopG/RHH family protein
MKNFPKFKDIAEEAEFWNTHDSTEYIDWSKAEKSILPNLKFTTESISIRLPSPMLARLKELANEKDVPYQSLMKTYLSERIDKELTAK